MPVKSSKTSKLSLVETLENLIPHQISAEFPELPYDELQALKDDIDDNGLQQPILIDESDIKAKRPKVHIIDGRNRHAAIMLLLEGKSDAEKLELLKDLNVKLVPAKVEDVDVVSANLARRHLSPSQRCMYIAKHILKGDADDKNIVQLSRRYAVSRPTLYKAKWVIAHQQEAADAVSVLEEHENAGDWKRILQPRIRNKRLSRDPKLKRDQQEKDWIDIVFVDPDEPKNNLDYQVLQGYLSVGKAESYINAVLKLQKNFESSDLKESDKPQTKSQLTNALEVQWQVILGRLKNVDDKKLLQKVRKELTKIAEQLGVEESGDD